MDLARIHHIDLDQVRLSFAPAFGLRGVDVEHFYAFNFSVDRIATALNLQDACGAYKKKYRCGSGRS